MKVGLAQIDTRIGDFAGNLQRAAEAWAEAWTAGAELVVLPELVLTGYPPRDLLCDDGFVAAALALSDAFVSATAAGPPVLFGTLARAERRNPGHPGLLDSAVLAAAGRVTALVAKRLLPSYGIFHETRWFTPGEPSAPATIARHKLGILICEDLWDEGYPCSPGNELQAAGAELLLVISASPFRPGVAAERLRLARRFGLPFVYLNAVGANDEIIFDGGSFVLDASGAEIARLPRFEEAVHVVDLDAGRPLAPEHDDDIERRFRALTLGVGDFAHKNGLTRAFLGLSGGVDSALVACIAREALGPAAVHALALPSRHNDPRSTGCARELAAALGIGFEVVPIDSLHGAAREVLHPEGAVDENVQARLRALVLMAHVNRAGGLLLNTSNKTELALGYGTLYGDMAGTLAVIGDLDKLEVYELARWYNERRGVIPRFILERPPSAELKDGQVDPFDYASVVPIVEALLRGAAASPETERYAELIHAAEHKRWQAGIVLRVSDLAFGSGRMVPVTRTRPG